MLNSKLYGILLFCSLFAFTGCIETQYNLDINTTLDNHASDFLKTLPGIKGAFYNRMPVTARAKKMEIYKASFSEATIEKDNLLEFTELNTHSNQLRVPYRDIDGFTQDIYLLKYSFSYRDGSEDIENTAVTFISLHYRPKSTEPFFYCTGPGPAYWGLVNDGYISFDSVLTVKVANKGHYLKVERPNRKNAFNLLFLPADFAEIPVENVSAFDIKKIVRMNANKVGGSKPLVFDIPVIFKDSKALHFTYIKTITLNN
jgi:hypothetical protein